jgi:RNA polymerase sigma factor (sigma-70 family)
MDATSIAPASDQELARAAIAGDGDAFAALYDRHERRAFNLAYRITGSREDAADATQEAILKLLARLPGLAGRELDFGAYLLTAVRHASYDAIARAGRATPSGELPETAWPVGAGAAPPPEEEPDRSVLLAASQEEIRAANATLAPRQREALALRELEGLSYDEIAELMALNRNAVAQLISRARIALRDALRRTALRSIVPRTPDCERALPLIAMRDDGQPAGAGDAWLAAHLAACERCVVAGEAMAEAGASYRIWAPVAAFEWLRRDTIAHAGELLGHGFSAAARPPRAPATGARGVWRRSEGRQRLFARPPAAGAVLVALCALILAVLPGQVADGEPPPPIAATASAAAPPASASASAPRLSRRATPPFARAVPRVAALPAATATAPGPAAAARPAAAADDEPPAAKRRPASLRDDRLRPQRSTTRPAQPLAPPAPPVPGGVTITDPPPPPPPPDDPAPEAVTDAPPPPPPPRTAGTFVVAQPPPPPRPPGRGSGVPLP